MCRNSDNESFLYHLRVILFPLVPVFNTIHVSIWFVSVFLVMTLWIHWLSFVSSKWVSFVSSCSFSVVLQLIFETDSNSCSFLEILLYAGLSNWGQENTYKSSERLRNLHLSSSEPLSSCLNADLDDMTVVQVVEASSIDVISRYHFYLVVLGSFSRSMSPGLV